MNITMLGTGNAMVTECYNTCFVLEDGDKHLLVDGGGGNTLLRQLKQAGFDWKDMREIFVTHKHVDHIMGVVWMIRMICQNMKQGQYDGEATIYGHEEVIRILKEMAEMLGISTTTVSNVINGKTSEVSQKTAEKVQKLLDEYDYVPNMNAKNLAQNHSRLIGIVLKRRKDKYENIFTDPFHGELLGALESAIREQGYYMMIYILSK